MTDAEIVPGQQLKEAFLAFNQVSARLADSYILLQQRIGQLSGELAAARGERMRQLAEKERFAHHFAQLLDTLPAGVVVIDAGGRVEQFNPAAEALFESIARGIPWDQLKEQFVADSSRKNEWKLDSGRVVNCTEQLLGGDAGTVMLLLDITETRRLQQQAERQQRLSAMGEVAAKLAHQIRTPISSALLYSSHLSRDDLTQAQRRRFSHRSRRCLLHMERQVNDMLSYARGGDYDRKPLEMRELLAELLHTLEPIAREREMALRVIDRTGESALISGDRDPLLGAMLNIAINALDHSPDGGVVSLGIREAGGDWELHIDDQGPGVPEQLQQQIFDPFFTTRNQGTGLGLAVSRAVASGHGGRIEVCAAGNGRGGSFRFCLPKLNQDQPYVAGAGDMAMGGEMTVRSVECAV